MNLYTQEDMFFDQCNELLYMNTVDESESNMEQFYAFFDTTIFLNDGPALFQDHIIGLGIEKIVNDQTLMIIDEIGGMIRRNFILDL